MKQFAKEVRQYLKGFERCKFSVTSAYNKINVTVLAAPFEAWDWDAIEEENKRVEPYSQINVDSLKESRNSSVNHFHIEESENFYTDEMKKILVAITKFLKRDVKIVSEDSDYGSIPNYYINLSVGNWDKPFEVVA